MSDSELAMIRDAAGRLLGDLCDRATIAAAEAGQWPQAMWWALEEAGLTLALVSEPGGGVGLAMADALDLVGLAAEHAAPVPLGETMLAAWLLDRAGMAIPVGSLTFAIFEGTTTFAEKVRLSGRVDRVPWGRSAALVLLVEQEGSAHLTVLDPCNLSWVAGTNMAGEPRDSAALELDLPAASFGSSPVSAAEMRQLGAALRAAQIAGALRKAADLTVLYATQRSQFGRTLSQFQAIQQSLAVLTTQAAVATAASAMAARAIDQGASMPAVAIAKARCGEAAGVGSAIAHQIHGAIGFTLEHDLQLSTRRLLAWRDEFGGDAEWNEVFGRIVIAAGGEGVWKTVTAR